MIAESTSYTNVDDLKDDLWTEVDYYLSLRGDNNINSDGTFEGSLRLMRLSNDSRTCLEWQMGRAVFREQQPFNHAATGDRDPRRNR